MLELHFLYFRWLYYYMMSQLVYVYYSMSNLKNLETLYMSFNKFSDGLPDVFTSMTSLRKLDMEYCKLEALPERLVKATQYKIQIKCFICSIRHPCFAHSSLY